MNVITGLTGLLVGSAALFGFLSGVVRITRRRRAWRQAARSVMESLAVESSVYGWPPGSLDTVSSADVSAKRSPGVGDGPGSRQDRE